MDVITYINTITTNTFADWLRCNNDIYYLSQDDSFNSNTDDNSVRIISHILKTLFNDKISSVNKCYLMVTIEEHLMYFIKTESEAINMAQSLITDFQKRLNSRWDSVYMCQVLTLTCSICVHFNLPLSMVNQSQSLTESIIATLMEIIRKNNSASNWNFLRHTSLCTLLHLEICYPTILAQKKTKFAELVQNEKSIFFELLLQIYSLIFKNDIINKCRQQHALTQNERVETSSSSELYDKNEINALLIWLSGDHYQEKFVGSQSHIFKSLLNMIQESNTYLTPLGINRVLHNCLEVVGHLSQHNSSLWDSFINRFARSMDINILEIFMIFKISAKNGVLKKSLLSDEVYQETLLSMVNNSLITLSKRLVAAHWLTIYPFQKQIAYDSDNYNCLLEPELIKSAFLRSFDSIEMKYCKLMLLSSVIKTTKQSDCNSVLLFSSLTELIKNVNYYETGIYSNILLRVMFSMHCQHNESVLINDFEKIFDNLVIRYPSILSSIVTYLNALNQLKCIENISPFSSRCLYQIAKLSNERLISNPDKCDINIVRMHIQVLNCVTEMSQLDMKNFLDVLFNLISSWKIDVTIDWLEDACALILELCFNVIKIYGSSNYYRELTLILNEIRSELLNSSMEIKANFLYAAIVSISSKKVMNLLCHKTFADLKEDDFKLIYSALINDSTGCSSLTLIRCTKSYTNETARFQYNGEVEHYLKFLRENTFPILFMTKLQPKEFTSSETLKDYYYGIDVEFDTSLSEGSVKSWSIQFAQLMNHDSPLIEQEICITVSKAESFYLTGRISATKLNGSFSFFTIDNEFHHLFELGLRAPIEFSIESDKTVFLKDFIQNKLKNETFVSIDFSSSNNYAKFCDQLNQFLITEDGNDKIYLIFLPISNHIVLKESFLGDCCRRFDIFTDLSLEDLISIEEYLKQFE